ncbi:FecR/PupR family sigma factor regulator [Variovorax sp. W2I14]|uniref:FecR/PupR family sigma factor regulator n=1 Tax=Variovorax sp. W2I14 TaxID=3042290 RepID=UPI003D1E844D
MQPTPHDERPSNARSKDACLSEALDWIVRLNRLRASDKEVRALAIWCARSAAHARAWREAMALWGLLLPAARCIAHRPRIARTPRDIRIADRSAASSDTPSPHYRRRQSWS